MHRAALVLTLALLLPSAGGAGPAPAKPVGILAIGDFGVGGESQQRLGDAVRRFEARNPASWLITLGDNDYTESPAAFRANWRSSFGWTAGAGVRVAGVLGNHDVRVQGGRYEYRDLGMPGRYYRRRVGPVELYLLDSNHVDAGQTNWLEWTLLDSRARWKIAAFHHPAFTCGTYGSNPEVVKQWVPLFEHSHVRLVLSGHDHNYQRFAPRRGVRYVVHGAGSTGHYDLTACPRSYPRRLAQGTRQGFLYLLVRGNRLDGWSVDTAGRRTDHFAFSG